MKISSKVLVRITSVLLVLLIAYFDYLYVLRLVDNWDLYLHSPVSNKILDIYYIGLAVYVMLNIAVVAIVRWCWE